MRCPNCRGAILAGKCPACDVRKAFGGLNRLPPVPEFGQNPSSYGPSRRIKNENRSDPFARPVAGNDQLTPIKNQNSSSASNNSRLNGILASDGASVHIVFVLDNSASMKNTDVKKSSDASISRKDAVFDATISLVENQLKTGGSARDILSLALFNDHGDRQLHRRPLTDSLVEEVKRLKNRVVPKFGTKYGQAFNEADRMIENGRNEQEHTILILLSDGKPGDHCGQAKAQSLMRKFKNVMIHTVGFGPEVMKVTDPRCSLKSIAAAGNGNLYDNAKLEIKALTQTFTKLSQEITATRTVALSQLSLPGMIKMSSPREGILESEHPDAWRDLRKVQMTDYTGQVMELDGAGKLHPNKQLKMRLQLHKRPFSEGAMRHAYHFWDSGTHLVAKITKGQEAFKDRLALPASFLSSHDACHVYTELFSALVPDLKRRGLMNKYPAPRFVDAFVYRLNQAPGAKGGRHKYLNVEEYISGSFCKYNGNDGFVAVASRSDASEKEANEIAQAFSHWSFEASQKRNKSDPVLITDIQGHGVVWTDPQPLSLDQRFGSADLGKDGMRTFFRNHKCGPMCKALGLSSPESCLTDLDKMKPKRNRSNKGGGVRKRKK